MKKALCISRVPSVLSPSNEEIKIGEVMEFSKEIWSNGEHHLILGDGKSVPSVFFDTNHIEMN